MGSHERDGEQVTGSLACSFPERGGRSGSLWLVRVTVCPGVCPERYPRCFAHPLGGAVCRGAYVISYFCFQHFVFGSGHSDVAIGFFGLFVSFCLEFALTGICAQLFLVSYRFFVFHCWRKGLSRCKHPNTAAKGPKFHACSRNAGLPDIIMRNAQKTLL